MTDETLTNVLERIDALAAHGVADTIDRDPSIETAVALLLRIQQAKRALSDAEAQVHEFLADVVPGGGYHVEGVGTVTVKSGAQRKAWDHKGLATTMIQRIAEDMGVPPEYPEAVVDRLLEAAAISYWRVGVLKEMGLQVDEFCETTWGPKKAVIG